MIHIKFLMNEIKFKIYYSNVRMYKNMMQAFIEYIHNAKNDSQSEWIAFKNSIRIIKTVYEFVLHFQYWVT